MKIVINRYVELIITIRFSLKFQKKIPRIQQSFRTAQSQIKSYYFGTNKINSSQLDKVIDLTSDIIFRYGIEKAVEAEWERRGKTYYYS